MKKSKFNLTHLNSTTLDMGKLVPFLLLDTLPNDTFRISMDSFIRAQPMLAPLMHEVYLYTQYWYVPTRLLWDEFPDFITQNISDTRAYSHPYIVSPSGGWKTSSLADYFGLPLNQEGLKVSAIPFRAYSEIWNSRYRDEDLQNEVPVFYGSGLDDSTNINLLSNSWKKDYFTTARASTQRGSSISVPVTSVQSDETLLDVAFQLSISGVNYHVFSGGSITSITINSLTYSNNSVDISSIPQEGSLFFDYTNNVNTGVRDVTFNVRDSTLGINFNITINIRNPGYVPAKYFVQFYVNYKLSYQASGKGQSTVGTYTFADWNNKPLSNGLSLSQTLDDPSTLLTVNGSAFKSYFNIRDLRLSSALQRFQERSLQWGNRYEEFIQREFGLSPKDSRIQRPEYLGGSRGYISISEVLQTSEGTDTGVGTMRGHGVSSFKQRPIRFTSPEHGYIIGLLSIRPKSVYTQGIDRHWFKFSKLDYYVPELANIGMQEVFQKELYATKDNENVIFGYQDRYSEYRSKRPVVTGEFRDILNFWNLARNFSEAPVLNSSFIEMAPSKRIFAEQTQNSFLAMIRNNVLAYRTVPKRAKNILK